MTAKGAAQLSVSVLGSAGELTVEIRDRRPDSVSLFGDLGDAHREQAATDAWSIGLRALSNAHAAAEESKLRDVGQAVLSEIDKQLRTHVVAQQDTIGAVLARFFDPKDGQVSQRLAAFVDDQGVLARLLDKY